MTDTPKDSLLVKPLEWRDQGATWVADTPFGGYQIDVAPYIGGPACHLLHGDSFLSPHTSLDDAMHCAFADFSERILSCLSSTTEGKP